MNKDEALKIVKEWNETEPDRNLFTLCYLSHDPPAFLHIIKSEYDDKDLTIYAVIVYDIIHAEIGIKTLYKMMMGVVKNIPDCFEHPIDYVISNYEM